MTSRPAFDELPILPEIGLRHAWDVYGPDDQLGALNLLTPERVVEAASEVRTGERIGLTLPMDQPSPPLYRRRPWNRNVLETARNNRDEYLDGLWPQGSSHWDGFRHVRCREFGFYQGITDEPLASGRLGVEHWADRGIVARGVLLDVAGDDEDRWDPLSGAAVSAADLRRIAERQGVHLREGDVLCVRFGWAAAYRDSHRGSGGRAPAFAGLAADEEMARMLWDCGIAAVAADNPGVEAAPGDPAVGSLHRRALALLGVPFGELFDFDRLAARARLDGHWTFLLTSVPWNLPDGIASPANAVAVR